MGPEILDNPALLSTLFYPQPARPRQAVINNTYDGMISVEPTVVLGYRLYAYEANRPLILFFHGNGEIAADYDAIAEEFRRIGTSLFVVDFRGYGWSTGHPSVTTLLSDVEPIYRALPAILEKTNLTNCPLFVMGRSLGSAPAIHIAYLYNEQFKGLIIESGFATVLPLLIRRDFPVELLQGQPDPIGNQDKVSSLKTSLLVIHGENDQLLPVSNGQSLYDVSPAEIKRILRIRHAGHNDLMLIGMTQYFETISDFIKMCLGEK